LSEAEPAAWTDAGGQLGNANDYLQGMVHWLRDTNPDVDCVLYRGTAARSIVDCAANRHVHQIVMASHGYQGLTRAHHGGVAERVVHDGGTPVFLVRGRETSPDVAPKPIAFRRVLVTLDGSKTAEQVLAPITAIARALECELILCEVYISFLFDSSTRAAARMAKSYLNDVAKRVGDQGIKVRTATQTGPVAETIVRLAKDNEVDLIAMCTHGRTGIARLTLGSTAAQILRAVNTPVLLVPARRRLARH
jgi:nucleotide-binding universal stress UspA family protein